MAAHRQKINNITKTERDINRDRRKMTTQRQERWHKRRRKMMLQRKERNGNTSYMTTET